MWVTNHHAQLVATMLNTGVKAAVWHDNRRVLVDIGYGVSYAGFITYVNGAIVLHDNSTANAGDIAQSQALIEFWREQRSAGQARYISIMQILGE